MSRRTQNMNDVNVIPTKRRRKIIPSSSDEESEPECSNTKQQIENEDEEMLDEVSFDWNLK